MYQRCVALRIHSILTRLQTGCPNRARVEQTKLIATSSIRHIPLSSCTSRSDGHHVTRECQQVLQKTSCCLIFVRTEAENDRGEQLQNATNQTPIDHCVQNRTCLSAGPSHWRRLSSSRSFHRGGSKLSSHPPYVVQTRIRKESLAVAVLAPLNE